MSAQSGTPGNPDPRATTARSWRIPILLAVCVVLVGFWEIMAQRSSRPFEPFELTSADFRTFAPSAPEWVFQPIAVEVHDPTAPNLLAYAAHPASGWRGTIVIRLVHGYNMPMCMKIKGYTVENLKDDASTDGTQAWRLTSESGDSSVWITAMARAVDYRPAHIDIRSMAFPRISARDDPSWIPRGLTLSSFRNPVSNFRQFLQVKWNNARCDIATFLKLRQPVWADEDTLVLLAHTHGASVRRQQEQQAEAVVRQAHAAIWKALCNWKAATAEDKP